MEDEIMNLFFLEHLPGSHRIGAVKSSVDVLLFLQLVKKWITKKQKKPLFLKSCPQMAILVTSSDLEQVPAVITHPGGIPCFQEERGQLRNHVAWSLRVSMWEASARPHLLMDPSANLGVRSLLAPPPPLYSSC